MIDLVSTTMSDLAVLSRYPRQEKFPQSVINGDVYGHSLCAGRSTNHHNLGGV